MLNVSSCVCLLGFGKVQTQSCIRRGKQTWATQLNRAVVLGEGHETSLKQFILLLPELYNTDLCDSPMKQHT